MTPEHFNVSIIGAGLSGIGAGVYLQRRCPDHRYAILEARDAIGGTWDLFRGEPAVATRTMIGLAFINECFRDRQAQIHHPHRGHVPVRAVSGPSAASRESFQNRGASSLG